MGEVMALTHHETRMVKGMLLRGDKQHDIAAYFCINGGRVGEVATGKCEYPNAQPLPPDQLPPPGPYLSKYALSSIMQVLDEAIIAIEMAESETDIAGMKVALSIAKETIAAKIATLKEL
jgi:hypothetical protein